MSSTNYFNLERFQKPSQQTLLGQIVNALSVPNFGWAELLLSRDILVNS